MPAAGSRTQAAPVATIRAAAIGWRAHAALVASGGVARVTAALSRSFYAEAAGEMIWVGASDTPLHPRAVLASDHRRSVEQSSAGAVVAITFDGVLPWRPPALAHPRAAMPAPATPSLRVVGEPRGFARVIADADVGHDLAATWARPHILVLARACADNDARAFAAAARPLLGLGGGLTPSGDDFVGGALFARRVLVGMDATWEAVATGIVADAAHRTHSISAQLLADLAAGEGWAPLHALIAAIAAADTGGAVTAARALSTIGHTSGWDMLAGVLAGLGVEPAVAADDCA